MEAFVRCWDGRKCTLPSALEWEFAYGLGSPCDGFAMTCIWEPGLERVMADAVRFWAVHGNQCVFTGIVDEYRCVRDEKGNRLEISGRGLQGLLLDNEALPMEYQIASLQDILQNHVYPYGIEVVGGENLTSRGGFAVSAGQSEWSVLNDFVRSGSDRIPYFDRVGRLILSGWEDKKAFEIGNKTVVTKLVYGESRYGVLSQVVVHDRKTGVSHTVCDEDWIRRGGNCRRVMTVGERDGTDLRKTGEYQLRLSRGERVTCEVTVAGLFCAFPGELVIIERDNFGGNGRYRVAEAVSGVGAKGGYTELLLRETDLLI